MVTALLTTGTYPAIATHDPKMIEHAKRVAREHGIAADRFEFQMLYGVRRDLRPRSRARDTGFACTSRSDATGTRTSCGGSASGRRMSRS
jgi:proline dehydrogenase